MAKVSVIIINWNSKDYLEQCLSSVLAQVGLGDEVIVVDNASSDSSAALVRKRFPNVRLIEATHNLGYAGGCNLGLEAAQGDVLFVLNPDVFWHENWLRAMTKVLGDPSVGAAGCKLLFPDSQEIQHAGGMIDWPRAMPRHLGYEELDSEHQDEARDVDYVTGAAWGFRRDTAAQVGKLDQGYWPAYYEDTDYCFRVREAGLRVLYTPEAVATHAESVTVDKCTKSYLRIFHRGRLRFVLKHLSIDEFLTGFVRKEREWLQGYVTPEERQAVGQAYRDALLMLPAIHARRGNPEQLEMPQADVLTANAYLLETDDPAMITFQRIASRLVELHREIWHPANEW